MRDEVDERTPAPSPAIANLVRRLLVELGENPERGGLVDTPERVARAYQFLTEGNQIDPLESSAAPSSRRTTTRW